MVEVKHNGDVALGAEGKQVLHSEANGPVIILHCQSGLAVVTQALKAEGKPVQSAELVTVHTPNMDVDLVPMAWLEPHQVQGLHKHAGHLGWKVLTTSSSMHESCVQQIVAFGHRQARIGVHDEASL